MQLVGVSFPRAGHHFLVRLLTAALGDQFSYCEFYGPVGCCRALPCIRPRAQLHLQKNHDFQLTHPKDLANCLYVVQHREPIGAAVSDREFYVRVEGAAVGASREDYEVWLGRKAADYVGFDRRWVDAPPPNSLSIDYTELSTRPVATVMQLLAAADVAANVDAVEAAATSLQRVGDFGVTDGFVPRPTSERPAFDRELLSRFESLVLDELPGRAEHRQLAKARRDPDDIIELAYVAASAELANDAPRALAAVERGLQLSPRHPLLLHWRGRIAWHAGDLALARRLCEGAVEELPGHPLLRIELAQVAQVQGDLVAAREHAEALRELREPDPGHDVQLAIVLAELGNREAASVQIARARARRSPEPDHWSALAHAAAMIDRQDLAAEIAAEAVAIWPQSAE